MDNKVSEAIDRLKKCISGTYMYRGRNVKILGYSKEEGDRIEIITETTPIYSTGGNLMATLDEFLEVEDSNEATEALAVFTQQTSGLDSLENTLMENIKKLNEDPSFLSQAKEINSTAKNLIQINKTKVDLFREIRKANV
jgi:hypothetical protein